MESYKDADRGKEIIRNKVIQLGFEFTDPVINRLAGYFKCETVMELYQRFGEGKGDLLKIKKALQETDTESIPTAQRKEDSFPETVSDVLAGKEDYVIIDPRIQSLHYQFARCCKPVPGVPIFAFVSVTQGIRIHTTTCPNARQLVTRYPYRIPEARWKPEKEGSK